MKRLSLTRYRHQASILLKGIRNGNPEAMRRIRQLAFFSSRNALDLQHQAKLKHCLNVIALEQGFELWAVFKSDFEVCVMGEIASRYVGGYLNHWYARYADARHHLNLHQGYLLPYKKGPQQQYYVCEHAYIASFGFDPKAKEWGMIGYDLVQPVDRKARLALPKGAPLTPLDLRCQPLMWNHHTGGLAP
ncbi:hypothetical protein EZI54_06060 [Marinobacter halodurans]|uniref:Uncharacterized protein n=1 Tax=Marinobacter halodurans TaxID=2528979 RepID=A0ABY1ZPL7_9GAMM|nr:hypothetical protein [Marinobacter halodurans]TBW57605.1 hypothetical protein EZI54_06060 [Marinobacter halodurans]